MALQRKLAGVLVSIAPLIAGGGDVSAAEPHPCDTASRYVMPEGVETGSDTLDVAPADVPGSRSGYKVPPKIGFDLALNPAGPAFDESRLPLGHVEIDRKSGQSTIDGQPLGGPSEAEAACTDAGAVAAAPKKAE